jgi:hypothetical protein
VDVSREAGEIVAEGAARGAVVRLVGSAGIRMQCLPAATYMDAIQRPAKDIDVVCRAGDRNAVRSLLEERGYEIDRNVLVALEGSRLAFQRADGLEVDVFVDRLEFCHTIELADRLDLHPATIPIEDLLLQKLQIVDLMPSDVCDTAALLATHAVGTGDDAEVLDSTYVASLLARDWGFHRTVLTNLDRFDDALDGGRVAGATAEVGARLRARLRALRDAIEAAPKSRAWKLRAKVGTRIQWWDDVPIEREHY